MIDSGFRFPFFLCKTLCTLYNIGPYRSHADIFYPSSQGGMNVREASWLQILI